MKHLVGHPNVVALVGAYEDKSNVNIIMEVCFLAICLGCAMEVGVSIVICAWRSVKSVCCGDVCETVSCMAWRTWRDGAHGVTCMA